MIRKLNGQPIVSSGDLPALIGQAAPGEKVSLEVWRQGRREDLTAKLGDASDRKPQIAKADDGACLLYTSPSPRDRTRYRMPSSA